MKIQKTICIVLVLSLTVAGGYACKKNEQANPADSVVVSFLSGKAEAKSTGGWEMIKVNDSLPLSATVRTSKGATIDMSVFGQAGIRLLGGTEFSLASLTKDKMFVKVADGNVLVKVGKLVKGTSLEVETPTAVAGVRGTEFWGQVTKENESGVFAVRDGSVEIKLKASGNTVTVNKGEAVEYSPKDSAITKRAAKEAELNAMSQIDQIRILE